MRIKCIERGFERLNAGPAVRACNNNERPALMRGLTCFAEVLNVMAVCLNADRAERGEAVDQRLLGHLILNPALNLLVVCIDYNDEIIQLVVTGRLNAPQV